ncbi:MAG: glucoamylase family protein [Cyclobacteriaceae bacterium]
MNFTRFSTSLLVITFGILLFYSCDNESEPVSDLQLISVQIGNESLMQGQLTDVALNNPIIISFNFSVDPTSFEQAFSITNQQNTPLGVNINFSNENKTITIYPQQQLETFTEYQINISDVLQGASGESFPGEGFSFLTVSGKLELNSIQSGDLDLLSGHTVRNVPVDFQIVASFSDPIDEQSINLDNILLTRKGGRKDITVEVQDNSILITPAEEISGWSTYKLSIDTAIVGIGSVDFDGIEVEFTTAVDSTLKFPEITDEELLTKIQEHTFKYFWDFGHPASGLARERNTSGQTVTIGGSGFGIMSIIVGIERGFITREQGVQRLSTIVNFLLTQAERFHGVWSHWLNGTTGVVVPFSADDDGGDLVETSFMIQGLLTVRQYLNDQNVAEAEIISKINRLYEEVEWDWYQQNDQNVLYWHWSPNFGWQKNLSIRGWNESLIVYLLAAGSPTHSIDEAVYTSGWARNGGMTNGSDYYDVTLPLGPNRGGPLFFSHYSFLGLDPRNLSDAYANYWEQNVAHSQINYLYCVDNPKNYVGYSEHCWGLTASDGNQDYSAHSPTNDRGVIAPTAAISSLPYTPQESMAAIRFFYYILGDRLWDEYGFQDAFNPSAEWTASSYIAIDQGPIILMIENYRTGLLWDLFMSAPEVQSGLTKLGFTYE